MAVPLRFPAAHGALKLGAPTLAALALAAGALAGCGAAGHAIGLGKTAPDEFRTVAKAPLVVPPDYALRPPSPGEPRPQELQPESQARVALLGRQAAMQRSDGENLLVAKAGVSKADPLIRYVVDDEYGSLTHKERSFADKVMFWKGPDAAARQSAELAQVTAPAPVDAKAEEAEVKKLTGGKTVVIARQPTSKVKLPGL